uniref:Zona pellucida sperm-binding protein 1 n=1 Tax=Laticauda laticaudata TaxID=8630 RepID=A0A8C5S8G4_LATLA
MGWGCSGSLGLVILVILGLCHGQADFWKTGTEAIQYLYQCGDHGLQLLVYPSPGQAVRFKVVDEFGKVFEVSNCPFCHHLITSHNRTVAFSAGYDGCGVIKKDGIHHLKVHLEELIRNGRVIAVHEINMICPKPQEHVTTSENNMHRVNQPQPALVHTGGSQLGLVHHGQSQPGLLPPHQPSRVHPGQSQTGQLLPLLPGQVHPFHPGLMRPGESQLAIVCTQESQPGHMHPGQEHPAQPSRMPPEESQPGMVHPLQPSLVCSDHVHPGEPFPGPVHPMVIQSSVGRPLTQHQCQVFSGRIPCADVQGPTACHQTGCCYDARDQVTPCYYGNTVTVQCLRDGYFILVISRDMLDYPIILESVRLSYAQADCSPIRKTESFLVFRFPLTQCGTTVQVTGGKLIYENQLVSGLDILKGPDGSITRDSTLMLHARCIYNTTDFLPLQVEVFSPPSPAPIFQVGPLRLELRIATDSSYTSYYSQYPIVKILRDPVHVEIRILQRDDPSLVLVLHECWATPSSNPLEQLQWPILVDGCPFKGDNYRTQLVPMGPATSELPFPNHYQRFIIYTFTFVDSAPQMVLDGLVYLFCSVSVCHPSDHDSCRVTCQMPVASRGRRFLKEENETESLDLVSTYGAVIFQENIHEKQM